MTKTEKLAAVMDYIQRNETLAKSLSELKFNGVEKKIVLIRNETYWSSASKEFYAFIQELGLDYYFSKAKTMHIFA